MGETSKIMELQLINAREEAELWRKTCRELEGHFFDLGQIENQEIELDKQLLSTIGMFNELYFQFDKKKFECFQVKKKFDDLVAKNGKFVYDTSLRKRVQHLEEQADLWLNHELKMKYFVEEYKGKYESLLLKFKEKKIEFDLIKDECKGLKEKIKGLEKRNKIKGTGGKEMMVKLGYLEDEYRKMEIEERGKCVQLSVEIEGLKSAKKRADEEVKELKIQATAMVAMVNANVELGKELEDYKAKYHGLFVQLNERDGLDGKLRGTIARLEEEKKNMEMDQTVKFLELEKQIEESKSAKKRTDDEFSVLEGKCMELEVQVTASLNYGIELGKELKNQMLAVGRRENELVGYKTKCAGMEKQIWGLIDEGNDMFEREKMVQDRVAYLEKVVKEMENDKRESEKRALDCSKWKEEEDEMESWKKKLRELVRRSSKMEEENLPLKGSQNEVSCMKIDGKKGVANMVHPGLPDNEPSSLRGNFEDVHIPDPHYNDNHQEFSENDTDNKKNTSYSMMESVIAVERKIAVESEGNLVDSLVLVEQGAVNALPIDVIEIDSENEFIEIVDSEDEKKITATHPITVERKELPLVSTDEILNASEKYVKRPLSLQRDEEGEASSDKAILTPWSQICSTSKRFKTHEISISRSVRQKDD